MNSYIEDIEEQHGFKFHIHKSKAVSYMRIIFDNEADETLFIMKMS